MLPTLTHIFLRKCTNVCLFTPVFPNTTDHPSHCTLISLYSILIMYVKRWKKSLKEKHICCENDPMIIHHTCIKIKSQYIVIKKSDEYFKILCQSTSVDKGHSSSKPVSVVCFMFVFLVTWALSRLRVVYGAWKKQISSEFFLSNY